MRIVQLIDSLETGGAERMAVNYANALAAKIAFSGLVVTRKEGGLKNQVASGVEYLFLQKKAKLDVKAFLQLRRFVLQHQIGYIHAHSSSFFLAVLVKLSYPKVKVIWHDHYGNSEFLEQRNATLLQLFSFFFSGIIVVNNKLLNWAKSKLRCKKVIYLPNFFDFQPSNEKELNLLKGTIGKRIVCLANLRAQKNHLLLLKVAELLKKTHPEWSFHLIGQDFEDAYSKEIKNYISQNFLSDTVFVYGAYNDVSNVLSQCDIGILTSKSEGLPVSLLEYGSFRLPVVVTSVGEIPYVIQNNVNGVLVPNNDVATFYNALTKIISDSVFKKMLAENLHETVTEQFSKKSIIEKYLELIKRV